MGECKVLLKAAVIFERDHSHMIHNFDFKLGDLILVRNTAIEKALNRKMCARYLGLCIVISRNKRGVYIIAELDGSVFDRLVAAFWVIPYFAWKALTLPPLETLIDISHSHLTQMENTMAADPEDDDNKDNMDADLLEND